MNVRCKSGRRSRIYLAAVVITEMAALVLMPTGPMLAEATSAGLLTNSMTPSNAGQTTVDGYPGASVTYTSNLSASESILVIGVVLNEVGQTVSLSVQGTNLAAQGSVEFFFSVPPGVSGNFTVDIFALTTNEVPLSVSTLVAVEV